MRIKVNGADIWARGGNMIPMDELEGRYSDAAHRRLVQSAVEGGFNIFRLWGGGIYQVDSWYEACDDLGVLIYHDMMYAQGNHAPKVTPTQDDEIRYQVRRLSEHPSIGIWDGCNECNGHGIYADFVMTTVAEEDPSRPPWPSCPSGGWSSGVDRLWSLPNGSPLGLQPRLSSPVSDEILTNTDTCTFLPHTDFAQGTIGPLPSLNAATSADCCSLCANFNDPKLGKCYAATLAGTTCWLKNQSQSLMPEYNSGTTGCWPSSSGPAPSPPTPGPINPPGTVSCQSVGYETHG
jgi:beta-mannosidase